MENLQSDLIGILVAIFFETGLCWLMLSGFKVSRAPCQGSPMFIVYANLVIQVFLMIPLPFIAWHQWGFALAWFTSEWDAAPRPYEHMMMFVTIGFCFKELPWWREMSALQWIHHVACIVGTGLMMTFPCRGICMFIFCTAVLEMGSCLTNVIFFYPENKSLLWTCLLVMTLSNFTVLCFLTWFCTVADGLNIFYIVNCTVALCFFRQKAANGYLTIFAEHGTMLPAEDGSGIDGLGGKLLKVEP